ncbi:hypothetical protein CMUS01_15613 [Colletotrichum musicola]|uniref:Uncharacterized protein n=1 Tax=Colletotrichum musicola TaxID=2175873 RepID=A0A8H6IVV6_9PEZI|nr:hypothetical protein CMUS01_15613 [Colletotrichum musicola]
MDVQSAHRRSKIRVAVLDTGISSPLVLPRREGDGTDPGLGGLSPGTPGTAGRAPVSLRMDTCKQHDTTARRPRARTTWICAQGPEDKLKLHGDYQTSQWYEYSPERRLPLSTYVALLRMRPSRLLLR